jgi:hypothetical protein
MSDLRTAAQQALEALEEFGTHYEHCPRYPTWARPELQPPCDCGYDKNVSVIRAALEQPEQEPVAWMVYTQDGKSVCVTDNPADFIEWRSFPLYTNPPRREWRGMTNLEFVQIELKLRKYHDYDRYDLSLNEFGRAIEAALKERNA